MLWYVFVLIGLSWLVQSVLGFFQIQHFNNKYNELKKLGRVAIGKKTGMFKAGTVVMFAIDSENKILKAAKMQGLTVFSKVKEMKEFQGKNLLKLTQEDLSKVHKLTRLAIEDALKSYDIISKGGELRVRRGWIDLLTARKNT